MLRCKYCLKSVEGEGFHPNKLQQIRWNLFPRVLACLFLSFLFVYTFVCSLLAFWGFGGRGWDAS